MASPDFEEEEKPQTARRQYAQPRKLMRWDPEEDQGVLLFVDHVCTKNGIQIPWDEVAKLVGGDRNLSGEAIKQHLAKVRAYRIEVGQQVPDKLEKGTRRRASLASSSANEETPAKRGRAPKIKKEKVDDEAVPEKPKKGHSLLYFKTPKKTKAPKKETGTDSTPSTTRRGGGRKKKSDADTSGESFENATTSTGKRGRKKQAVKDEEAEDSTHESPTKKPRTRAKARVDYRDPPAEVDEEEGGNQNDWQKDGEDANYGEVYDMHSYRGTQTSLTSSQASAMGESVPQQFAAPIGYDFDQGAHASHIYNGAYSYPSLSGLPMRSASDMMHPNMSQASAAANYNFNSFQSNMPMGYSGYSEAPNFPILSDPHREQELREAISSKLPVMQHEEAADVFAGEKVPRKKATPKTKNNRNATAAKPKDAETMSTPKSSQKDSPNTVKMETSAALGNVFAQDTSGTIPIVDGTAENDGIFAMNHHNTGFLDNALPAHHHNSSMNLLTPSLDTSIDQSANTFFATHGNIAPLTPIVDSPTDIFGNQFSTPFAHTGITPSVNNMAFDNFQFSNPLSHTSSHSSSFDSVYLSESNQAVPSIESDFVTSFDSGPFDPNEYERPMPGDHLADMSFDNGMIFYDH